jgi:glutathione S-transferase
MGKLILHELTGSPNNVKARVALGYKKLEYERKPFELTQYPGDRSPVVRLARQPRLPVLQDGETVIFDSGAIMRYLEANYPDTPPLFVEDHATFGELERWEVFARTQLGEPVSMMFQQAFAESHDRDVVKRANDLLHERTSPLEDRLSTNAFLVADHMTAADVACGSLLYLADMTEEHGKANPIAGFFQQNFALREGREKTRAWVRRVMAHDAVLGRR